MNQKKPLLARKALLSILKSMKDAPAPFVRNPEKDFTRHRALSLSDVILFTMNLESHSLSKELHDYWAPMSNQPVPTKSAFTQQRKKINPSAFLYLLDKFNSCCPATKKLKGLHVLAFDGSDLNVPADKRNCAMFIPYNSKNSGYYQLHTNVSFDILNNRYIDTIIQPRGEFNETAAACDMVDRNPICDPCLHICDRGYENFNLMAHIIEKGHYFLIRAKEISSSVSPYHSMDLPCTKEFDIDVHFTLARSRSIQTSDQGLRKVIRPNTRFDYIDPDDLDTVYYISYRLIKVEVEPGSFEYLLTNLPREKFTLREMKDLYHLRWKVETSFLFLKYGICLNYFHSVHTDHLYQEIYAKLLLFNFISYIISAVIVPEKERKYKYKISFSDAIYLCRDFLQQRKSWKYTLTELLRHLVPERPDRSFERKMRSQRLRSLQHRS